MGRARFSSVRSSSRSGSALVAALIVVTLVAAMGAGLVQMNVAINRRNASSVDTKRALYIAESGLSEAWYALVLGQSGNIGTPTQPALFGDGVYWVEATDLGDGVVSLKSTGLCGSGRFSLASVVRASVGPAGNSGVIGVDKVVVGAGATLDGFDSSVETYDDVVDSTLPVPSTGKGAILSSNADLTLLAAPDAKTYIYGNVHPGPDGSVSVDPGVLVTGSTAPLQEQVTLAEATIPIIKSKGSITSSGSTPLTLTGSLHYDTCTVEPRSSLVLEGPAQIVVDALEVQGSGELLFDTSKGPVELYITSSAHFERGSILANTGMDATQAALYLSDLVGTPSNAKLQRFIFAPGGTFYGVIYGPSVEITIPSSLRIFGSVVGKTVTLDAGARMTFDAALASGSALTGIQGAPAQDSWWIAPLPDEPIVRNRLDPLVQIELAGGTADDSGSAHREVNGTVRYVDSSGNLKSFTGDVRTMDWQNVSEVKSVEWDAAQPADLQEGDGGGKHGKLKIKAF